MIYRVLLNGQDILDYTDENMILIPPKLNVELNKAGSFEFMVLVNHKFYNSFSDVNMIFPIIEVYEDNILHQFGRPIDLSMDFYKQKKIYCEGALAFFNDSVQMSYEYDEVPLCTFFAGFAKLISILHLQETSGEGPGSLTITVKWKRPVDNKELVASFKVAVEKSPGNGGR